MTTHRAALSDFVVAGDGPIPVSDLVAGENVVAIDAQGRLTTHAPATYKIPVASDAPPEFRTRLHMRPNPIDSIYRSKAVGEPPLMLAISVYSAILDAVHAVMPGGQPRLEAPCTPESILNAIQSLGA